MADVAGITMSKAPSYVEIVGLDEKIRALARMVPEDSKPVAIPPVSSCMWHILAWLQLVDDRL
jgi:hypothetical protein